MVLAENVAGALNSVIVTGAMEQLTTTLLTNSASGAGANTSTTADIYPNEARGDGAEGIGGDAVIGEADVEEIATPASSKQSSWLG